MAVISLRRALAEQDHIAAALQAANGALAHSIQAAGQYAVVINDQDAESLRTQLTRLSVIAEHASTAEDYDGLQASVRGELREYRDKAARELVRMRAEVEAAASAMQNLADAVASSGAGHERRVHDELTQLESAARGEDLGGLRAAVTRGTGVIRASCDEVMRANALTIAQLRDEIRALHHEVERERRAQWVDRATGGWNRLKADTKIKDLIRLNQPFCVLLAGLNHLTGERGESPAADMRDDVIRALLGRLESISGEDALIGRWSEDVFAVIIDVPRGSLPVTPERMQAHASGVYTVQRGGEAYELLAAVKVALVERVKGVTESELYPRLGQAAFAVIAA